MCKTAAAPKHKLLGENGCCKNAIKEWMLTTKASWDVRQ